MGKSMEFASILLLLLAGIANADELKPRVLFLGDVSYNEMSRTVAKETGNTIETTWKEAGSTSEALENLDQLLGDKPWDVIHFNFGFADLHYKDPRTRAVRAMSKFAGGVRVTSPELYEKNLAEIMQRLKATRAKLIWASTTPILKTPSEGLFDVGSEIEYNIIAAQVAQRHGVAINDLHTFVMDQIDPKRPPDMFNLKGVDLHKPIIEAIENQSGAITKTTSPDAAGKQTAGKEAGSKES